MQHSPIIKYLNVYTWDFLQCCGYYTLSNSVSNHGIFKSKAVWLDSKNEHPGSIQFVFMLAPVLASILKDSWKNEIGNLEPS